MTQPRTPVDNDLHKGASESQSRGQHSQNSMSGQLNHRTEDEMLKDNDSDFPEPGENPEHSGQKVGDDDPEGLTVVQDPGKRQKQNQNKEIDDPLAA